MQGFLYPLGHPKQSLGGVEKAQETLGSAPVWPLGASRQSRSLTWDTAHICISSEASSVAGAGELWSGLAAGKAKAAMPVKVTVGRTLTCRQAGESGRVLGLGVNRIHLASQDYRGAGRGPHTSLLGLGNPSPCPLRVGLRYPMCHPATQHC